MNIYDISKKAGVSIATVSRVLNGSDKVSAATRARVLAVIEQAGYMPNAFARSLGLNSMQTVGMLCADASDVYLAQAVQYLERELRENGYTAMLCCTGYALKDKQAYLELLLRRNVDALFLVGSQFIESTKEGNAYLLQAAQKVPVFLLNGSLNGENVYGILCDDEQATYELTQKVLKAGACSPVYLYRYFSDSSARKCAGFSRACEEAGLSGGRCFACPGSFDEARAFLEQCPVADFDAVLAADDGLAVGAVKYALAHEKRLPEDLQVAGYNNSLLSTCSTPELTTVDNRVEFLCATAVSLLMQVLQQKDVPQKSTYSATIVPRETTLF